MSSKYYAEITAFSDHPNYFKLHHTIPYQRYSTRKILVKSFSGMYKRKIQEAILTDWKRTPSSKIKVVLVYLLVLPIIERMID